MSQRPLVIVLRLIVALAAVHLTLLFDRPACAQGTSGTLPDPITTRELMTYADRLHLSDQQRQAISALHDEYKREFRLLREGEISQFLEDMRGAEQGSRMPQRKVVEDIFKRMSVLNRRIETLDNQLFDQMQNLLTAEQLADMPRVRLARERQRYSAQRMLWIGGTPAVDLSELVMELKLAEAEMQAANGVLVQYETSLTSQMGKLHAATARMFLDMFDTMEQMGMADVDMEDPEQIEKFGQAMQTVWMDLTKKSMALSADIADLNRRTLSSLSSTLPPETARAVRNKFYTTAYPETSFAFADEEMFAGALRLRELTEEQRHSVIAARDMHRTTMDGIGMEAVEAVEDQRRGMTPFDYNQEVFQNYQKKFVELQTRAAQARGAAVQSLQAAIGPELAAKLPGLHPSSEKRKGIEALANLTQTAPVAAEDSDAEDEGDGDDDLDAMTTWGGDQFLPSAITDRELEEYRTMLGVDEQQKVVVDDLYEQYKEAFAQLHETEVKKLNTKLQELWHYDQETGKSDPPEAGAIEEVYSLRKAALLAALAVDSTFFEDMSVAALSKQQTDRMDRVKLARQRAVYNRPHYYSGIAWGGSTAAGIDLTRFMRPLRLTVEEQSAVDPALREYETQVTAAFVARYEAALATQRAQDQWNAQAMASQEDGNSPMQLAMKYQQVMGAAQVKLRDASETVAALNRRTLETLVSALPPTAASDLQSAFNRRAYPDVYNDGASADRPIRSAFRLADLTDDQRRLITDLAAEFHPEYSNLCVQMVDVSEQSQMPIGASFEADDWKKWQERQEVLSKLTFDRNELNARTIRTLRTILTEVQVERLGGLPDPKPEDHNPWD